MDVVGSIGFAIAYVVHLVQLGGPAVYFLLIMLVWSLVIIVIKIGQLRRNRIINPKAVAQIEKLLLDDRLAEATAFCKKHSSPMTRIILAGILHYDRPESELKERLEEAGRQEFPTLRAHLSTLRSLASAGPLVGLFGTVVGMISVFNVLSKGGAIQASDLAGGISEALIATACGLLVALPSIVFYNDFSNRVTVRLVEMEKISLHLVALLKRGK